MILRVFRILSFLRILREERDRYRDLARDGALSDSDMTWPSIDEAPGCARGEHRAAGESMPDACADCGVDWNDLDAEAPR